MRGRLKASDQESALEHAVWTATHRQRCQALLVHTSWSEDDIGNTTELFKTLPVPLYNSPDRSRNRIMALGTFPESWDEHRERMIREGWIGTVKEDRTEKVKMEKLQKRLFDE